MRFRIAFVITLLALFHTDGKSATVTMSGIHDYSPSDLIVLDTVSSQRDLGFGLGLMRGDQITFLVRYANLNALNIPLGDSALSAGFSILDGEATLLEIDSIVASAFAETSCAVNSQTDSLVVRLLRGENSDPLVFYRPCLMITDDMPPNVYCRPGSDRTTFSFPGPGLERSG